MGERHYFLKRKDFKNYYKFHGGSPRCVVASYDSNTDELCYDFEIRENEDLGILGYGLENRIINVPYQPLRRNRTAKRNWPLLKELSQKYGKTQNQIIINWLTARGLHPLVKSETIAHIDENLAALEFKMEKDDLEKLTEFRVPGYQSPGVDWFMKGKKGVFIHALPNIFDENYPEN